MAVNLSSLGGAAGQFFDNNGDPLTGGKIYTYAAGTTTPLQTYTTSTGNTPHSNPIILDAAGRVPGGEIWLTNGVEYKFAVKTSVDVQIAVYDDIYAVSNVTLPIDASNVGYVPPFTNSVATTVKDKLAQSVSVKDFGAVGDGVTDDYTAIINALNAAISGGKQLVFPPGIYAHSGVINFASQRLRVKGEGLTRLRYLGSQPYGLAVASDNNFTYDVWVENLYIEANNRAYGFYIKNTAHCVFKDIMIVNASEYGAYLEGTVLDTWENLRVTSNPPPLPGITVSLPKYGLYINGSTIASQATDNTFINPIIEGVSEIGIVIEDGAHNTFIGGTSEGNSGAGGTWNGLGIYIGANSPGNTFNNMFCEANRGGDLVCFGKDNLFLNCNMNSLALTTPYDAVKSIIIKAGATQNRFSGCSFYAAQVDAGSEANSFEYCDSGDKIDDAGTRNQILWTRQSFNGTTIVPGYKVGNLANTDPVVLDWYQEGTFTPTFGGSAGDGSLTYDIQEGHYTRIGDTVIFNLLLRVTVVTAPPSGDLLVRGLPFTSSSTSSQYAVAVGNSSGISLPASRVNLTAYVLGGASFIRLVGTASGLAGSLVQGSTLGSSLINIGGSYKV